MEQRDNDEPCLVSAGQGSRVLNTVYYKKRFLYSKYDPTKSVVNLIQSQTILPGTLILVCSPVLWYGINELQEKISESSCKILALEADEKLLELSRKSYSLFDMKTASTELLWAKDYAALDAKLRSLVKNGSIKRVLRLDFSAGVQLDLQTYEKIFSAASEIIERFWKNRITLVKFGRLYFKNFFRNIKKLQEGFLLSDFYKSVSKPIIVCGAGESLDKTFSAFNIEERNNYFIIAADASLASLSERGILPDALVGVEAQFAIQKAYIGQKNKEILFFADLFSRSEIPDILGGTSVWFSSEFVDSDFLFSLKEKGIIDSFIPALGSVGLYAVYIALLLRSSKEIPVFVTGLDFSFSLGLTHAKNTAAHISRLTSSKRTFPQENYEAAFGTGSLPINTSPDKKIFSTKALFSYASQFEALFSGTENLFDSGKGGIPLGLPLSKPKGNSFGKMEKISAEENALKKDSSKITSFLDEEKTALKTLRSLLSQGEESEYRNRNESLDEQIKALLFPREYLFLHFPDGYAPSMEISFLKRVRAEIDFFLKQMEI